MYDTVEEFKQKIEATVVLYDGKPVYVHTADSVDGKIVLYIEYLPLAKSTSSHRFLTEISDPLFDFRSIGMRLGYINYAYNRIREAVYSCRVPVRKAHQTQGLSVHNTRINYVEDDPENNIIEHRPDWGRMLSEKYLADTLNRSYPTLKEIGVKLEKDLLIKKMAFTSQFAISRIKSGPFYLLYKDEPIGWSEDLHRFRINNEYEHIKETFEDIEEINIA